MAALAYATTLCVLGAAMAHGGGGWSMNGGGGGQGWGNNMGGNQGGNQWGNQNPMAYFQDMMRMQQMGNMGMGQGNMGMGQGNMGQGNMGMGQGNMGMGQGNMGMGQMNQGMGQQNSMMSNMMMLLISNMLSQQGMGQQRGTQASPEEVSEMENLMKWNMMTEMADMMMVYTEYKEKEKEFSESMEALCWMVNATYNAVSTRGYVLFRNTTDEWMEMKGREMENWSEQQKMDYAMNMIMTDQQTYGEIFFRFAAWSCMTGESFAKAVMKMDRMNRGDDSCHDK